MSSLYQKHIPCLSISQSSVDYAAIDGVDGEVARLSVNCNLIYSFSVDDFFPAEEVPYRNKRLFTAVLGSNLHITKIDPVYINDPFIGSILSVVLLSL